MIYGLKAFNESVLNFSEQEIKDYSEIMAESMLVYTESFEEDTEVLEEGANLDYRAAYKKATREFKDATKACKKAVKNKDKAEAKKQITKMNKALDDCEKTIKGIDSSVGSAVLGYFAGGLLHCFEMFLPSMIYGFSMSAGITLSGIGQVTGNIKLLTAALAPLGVANVSGIVVIVKNIIALVKSIKQFIDDLKDNTDTASALNLYRNKLLTYISDFRKSVNKYEKLVEKI